MAFSDYNWTGATNTRWSVNTNWLVSGSVPLSAPTAADSVFFSGTFTVDLIGTNNCLNLTVSSGAVSFITSSANTLNILGSVSVTSGTTWASTASLVFAATSPMTITSNTSVFPALSFIGTSTYTLSGPLSCVSTTLSSGTITLSSTAGLTTGRFTSTGSTSRGIDFGSGGSVTCNASGGTLWATASLTGFSLSGTGRTVNISNPSTTSATVNVGSSGTPTEAQLPDFNITSGNYTLTITASSKLRNLNFTGTYTGNVNNNVLTIYGDLTLNSSMGLNSGANAWTFIPSSGNTRTITSNTKTMDFPVIFAGAGTSQLNDNMTVGSGRITTLTSGTLSLQTFTLTTGFFSSSNSNARTIAFGSSGSITVNASGGNLWDTTTLTGPLTVTGTNPLVSVTSSGVTTPNILTGAPSEANSISFSFFSSSASVTFGTSAYVRNLTVQSTHTGSVASASTALTVYGNLTRATGSGSLLPSSITFASTSATVRTIASGGATSFFPITFNGVGGSWALSDSLTMSSSYSLSLTNGTIDLSGQTLTVGTSFLTTLGTKALTFSGGTLVCPGGASAFNNAQPTFFTTNFGTGTVAGTISMTGASSTFGGGGSTYRCTLNYGSSSGTLTITGANVFDNITNSVTPCSFIFQAFVINQFTDFNINGTSGNLVNISSSISGYTGQLYKATGVVSCDYLSIIDSQPLTGASWYAGANSVNNGNTSLWIFTAPPVPGSNTGSFFMMF